MKQKFLFAVCLGLFSSVSMSQILPNGGGVDEPEVKPYIEPKPSKKKVNIVDIKSQKDIKRELDEVVKLTKKQWSSCYQGRPRFKDFLELYQVLSIEKASVKLEEKTESYCPSKEMECLFKNKEVASGVRKIINDDKTLDYIREKELIKHSEIKEIKQFFDEIIPPEVE